MNAVLNNRDTHVHPIACAHLQEHWPSLTETWSAKVEICGHVSRASPIYSVTLSVLRTPNLNWIFSFVHLFTGVLEVVSGSRFKRENVTRTNVFLFNDLLLWTSTSDVFKGSISLLDASISVLLNEDIEFATHSEVLVLRVLDFEHRHSWLKDINRISRQLKFAGAKRRRAKKFFATKKGRLSLGRMSLESAAELPRIYAEANGDGISPRGEESVTLELISEKGDDGKVPTHNKENISLQDISVRV